MQETSMTGREMLARAQSGPTTDESPTWRLPVNVDRLRFADCE
jgi:hypothetical protein